MDPCGDWKYNDMHSRRHLQTWPAWWCLWVFHERCLQSAACCTLYIHKTHCESSTRQVKHPRSKDGDKQFIKMPSLHTMWPFQYWCAWSRRRVHIACNIHTCIAYSIYCISSCTFKSSAAVGKAVLIGLKKRTFANNIFKHIFLNENYCILFKMPLEIVPKGVIDFKWALVQMTAWNHAAILHDSSIMR